MLLLSFVLAAAAPGQGTLTPPPPPPPIVEPPPPAAPAELPRPLSGELNRFEYEGHPVPGFRVVRSVRKGLLIPGAIVLVSAWALSGFSSFSITPLGLIPLVGPFVAAGELARSSGAVNALATALLVTAGLAQLAGAGLLVAAIAAPEFWLERDVRGVQLALVPTPTGAQLIGRF